jgi:hypothetical protein
MIALGFLRCNAYFMQDGRKRPFYDKLKRGFHARMDWWHPRLKVSAESKFHTLNTKTTQDAAENGLASQKAYRALNGQTGNERLEHFDNLSHQWSHSQVKQAIVQQALSPYEQIVFFEKPPTFEEMFTYTSKGLFPVALAAMPSYLANIRLQPTGATTFQASYTLATGERAVFNLGKYTANSPADSYVCEFIPGKPVQWLQALAEVSSC